jgi:hypothetical protein
MLGPVIGQILFTLVRYEKTFFIFAAVLTIAMVIIILIIPNKINHTREIFSKSEIDGYFAGLKSTEGASTF